MNSYPKFEKGMILKKEMLTALRDYPRDILALMYQDYGVGIITGFHTQINDDNSIVIAPGIIKLDQGIFSLEEEVTLETYEGQHYVYLKLETINSVDMVITKVSIIQSKEFVEENIELFRYTKNAKLLPYSSFNDVGDNSITNRVNKAVCKYAVQGGSSIAPEYLQLFASELLKKGSNSMFDYAFATQCLAGDVSIVLRNEYLNKLSKTASTEYNNEAVLRLLKLKIQSLDHIDDIKEKPEEVRNTPKKIKVL
ncbi:MAG: hypothetical protein K0S47_4330 [Herbinix sp.]|jgi:hypothetical protein|nr:hypothetical protein [Herbinix sp.]